VSDPIRLRDDPSTAKSRQRLLKMGGGEMDLGYGEVEGLARLKRAIGSGSSVRKRLSRQRALAPMLWVSRFAAAPALWLWLTLPAAAAAGWWAVHHAPAVWQHLRASPPLPGVQPQGTGPSSSPKPTSEISNDSDKTPIAEESTPPAAPTPALSKKSAIGDESRDRLLAAETTQLAELRRLAQTDPRRAVILADEGARQYPNGFFSQEREAIAITSLLRLGREADARGRAERFLVRYPRGPAAEKIRKAVGLAAD
jgi:hypothetical protein